MKKLLLITLTLALGTPHMHAMFMVPFTMEDNETAIKVHKSSCAKDCACAAKACCFMCALCGFLTAPAVAAPVRIQPPWLIPDEGLPAKVQVKQTYDISFIKSGTLALACFINPRTK